jgi:type 1 glutamine amidotransferase
VIVHARHRRSWLPLVWVAALVASLLAMTPVERSVDAAPLTRVLVFTKTAGFRHSAIPAGIAAIRQLGADNGFAVVATENAASFTTANLAKFQAVVWLSTTGDVLDASHQAAFESYIKAGGGYVGVHAAADTEHDWPWYGNLVGAYFAGHPAPQVATLRVEDRGNASTAHLPTTWTRADEWYDFQTNPRARVRVLLSLFEASYAGGVMGDHPIAWCQSVAGGRSWYTALGHTEESYADPAFVRMLLGGIRIAAGAVAADCSPRPAEPSEMRVALRSIASGGYVAAEAAGALPLIANRGAIGPWEEFELVDRGGDVALRSRVNGRLVCADHAGASPLIANRDLIGAWETYELIRNPDGTVSFRSRANGRLVVAENAGADWLVANRDVVGPWEKFHLVVL